MLICDTSDDKNVAAAGGGPAGVIGRGWPCGLAIDSIRLPVWLSDLGRWAVNEVPVAHGVGWQTTEHAFSIVQTVCQPLDKRLSDVVPVLSDCEPHPRVFYIIHSPQKYTLHFGVLRMVRHG